MIKQIKCKVGKNQDCPKKLTSNICCGNPDRLGTYKLI